MRLGSNSVRSMLCLWAGFGQHLQNHMNQVWLSTSVIPKLGGKDRVLLGVVSNPWLGNSRPSWNTRNPILENE